MKTPSTAKHERLEAMSDRIRRVRVQAKINQAELARKVGVTSSAVAQWESTTGTQPSLKYIVEIARLCGASLEWIVTGEGRMRHRDRAVDNDVLVAAVFAHDLTEENLLIEFRRMPTAARRLLVNLIQELSKARGRGSKRD